MRPNLDALLRKCLETGCEQSRHEDNGSALQSVHLCIVCGLVTCISCCAYLDRDGEGPYEDGQKGLCIPCSEKSWLLHWGQTPRACNFRSLETPQAKRAAALLCDWNFLSGCGHLHLSRPFK